MVQSETNRSERSRWIALRRTDSETRSVDSPCQRSGNRSKTQVAPPQPCSGHTVRRHSLGDENRSKARTRNFPSATRKAKTTIKVECPLLRFPPFAIPPFCDSPNDSPNAVQCRPVARAINSSVERFMNGVIMDIPQFESRYRRIAQFQISICFSDRLSQEKPGESS